MGRSRSVALDCASAAPVVVAKLATRQDVRHRRRVITTEPLAIGGPTRTKTRKALPATDTCRAGSRAKSREKRRRITRLLPSHGRTDAPQSLTPRRRKCAPRSRSGARPRHACRTRREPHYALLASVQVVTRAAPRHLIRTHHRATVIGKRRGPQVPGPLGSNTPATGAPQCEQCPSARAYVPSEYWSRSIRSAAQPGQ